MCYIYQVLTRKMLAEAVVKHEFHTSLRKKTLK